MKKSLIIIIILFTVLSIGCGGSKKTRVTDDSFLSKQALDVIKTIERAYEEKNQTLLRNKVDPAYVGRIIDNFGFEQVDLTITPWIIRIKDSFTIVNVDWEGTWLIQDREMTRRGISDFVLKGDPIVLSQIDGDDPFIFDMETQVSVSKQGIEIPQEAGVRDVREDKRPVESETSEVDKDDLKVKKVHRLGIEKKAPPVPERVVSTPVRDVQEVIETKDQEYHVQVGAWLREDYAIESLRKVKKYYPEAFIIIQNRFHKIRIPGVMSREQGTLIIRDIEEKLHFKSILVQKE